MHRRARHIKSKSVGASAAFDARYISGLSNASAVTTWYDLSGNSNDAAQSTASYQPTYETSAQGGQPGVKFDGSNDYLTLASFISLTQCSILVAVKIASLPAEFKGIFYQGNHQTYVPNSNQVSINIDQDQQWYVGNYDDPNYGGVQDTVKVDTGATVVSGLINDSGTTRLYKNSVERGTNTSVTISINSSTRAALGSLYPPSTRPFDGHILSAWMLPSIPSKSLLRRLEHANAFSFKIACS